jgi:hypothetical protein
MSTYAWTITRDHLADDNDNEAGVTGPRDAPDALLASLRSGHGKAFRMYDDDGELYYSGRWVSSDDGLTEDAFGPLDDFGTPNAGCTEIRYRDGNKWVTL